jgi:hypothetical protein
MTTEKAKNTEKEQEAPLIALPSDDEGQSDTPKEYGGRKKGLDATRYGDWEKDGRAIDF